METALRDRPGLTSRPRPGGRRQLRDHHRCWLPGRLRQRCRRRPRRRHHLPVRTPRPNPPRHRTRDTGGGWAGPRARRLHRFLHRQPPPLRGHQGHRPGRPDAIHGRARSTIGWASRRTQRQRRHGGTRRRGGRHRVRLTRSRHPAASVPEHPGRPDPAAREGLVRRGRPPVPAALDPARRDRDGGDRPRRHPRNLTRRRPRPDAVHARHLRDLRGRRRPRRAGEHHQRRRQHLLRRELPHQVRRHHRSGRGASCPVRVQPRRLVRQRRPALRPRLRRQTPPTPRPAPTEVAERGRQAHPRRHQETSDTNQGGTPCSRTDAPPPTRTPGRSR